jgi:hypothetical protein
MRDNGLLVAVLIAAVLVPSAASAMSIGVLPADQIGYSGGVFDTGDYATLRATLTGRGDTWSEVATLTPASLAGLDAFYTSLVKIGDTLTASEQTALYDWVNAGGILLLAGDIAAWQPTYNSWLSPFGLAESGGTDGTTIASATVVAPAHPLVNGPNGVVPTFSMTTFAYFAPDSYTTVATYLGNPVLIDKAVGSGFVTAVGDHNMFTDSWIGTNEETLFLNALDRYVIPEPGTALLLALGIAVVGARVWRRRRA